MSNDDDDAQLGADLRAVVEEMIAAWESAPGPAQRRIKSGERAESAEVGADVVIWAWTNRVVRTARGLLVLHDAGLDVETSPLRRTLLEHAVAIHWLADKRGPAYQALVRARSLNMQKLKSAQEAGWQLNDEQQRLLDEAISIETDSDTLSEDTFLHAKQRAEAYGLGSLHQGWIIETWTSHPSLMSALPYYQHSEEPFNTELYPFPKAMDGESVLGTGVGLHVALTGYERLVADAFGEKLAVWGAQLIAVSGQLRALNEEGG